MAGLSAQTPEFEEFARTAQSLRGSDGTLCKDWLLEIWSGADANSERAINHMFDTPDNKVRYQGQGGGLPTKKSKPSKSRSHDGGSKVHGHSAGIGPGFGDPWGALQPGGAEFGNMPFATGPMNQISQQPGMMPPGTPGMISGQQPGMIPAQQPGMMPSQITGMSGQQVGMMPGPFGAQFSTQNQACSPQTMMPGVGHTAGLCGQCALPFGSTMSPPPTLPPQQCLSQPTPQVQLLGSNQFGVSSLHAHDPSAIQREIQNVERELELEHSRQQNQIFGSQMSSSVQGGIPYGGFDGYEDSDSDNDWWNQPDRYTPASMHGFGSSGMPSPSQHSNMTQPHWSPGGMQCMPGTQWSPGAAQVQACGALGPQMRPFGVM